MLCYFYILIFSSCVLQVVEKLGSNFPSSSRVPPGVSLRACARHGYSVNLAKQGGHHWYWLVGDRPVLSFVLGFLLITDVYLMHVAFVGEMCINLLPFSPSEIENLFDHWHFTLSTCHSIAHITIALWVWRRQVEKLRENYILGQRDAPWLNPGFLCRRPWLDIWHHMVPQGLMEVTPEHRATSSPWKQLNIHPKTNSKNKNKQPLFVHFAVYFAIARNWRWPLPFTASFSHYWHIGIAATRPWGSR